MLQDGKKMLEKKKKKITESPREQKRAEAQFLMWLSFPNPLGKLSHVKTCIPHMTMAANWFSDVHFVVGEF